MGHLSVNSCQEIFAARIYTEIPHGHAEKVYKRMLDGKLEDAPRRKRKSARMEVDGEVEPPPQRRRAGRGRGPGPTAVPIVAGAS